MSPEEQVQAANDALAEVGIGLERAEVAWGSSATHLVLTNNARIRHDEPHFLLWYRPGDDAAKAAVWRAVALVSDEPHRRCWPCWDNSEPSCDHDWRTEPWPPVPERVS